MKKKLKGSIGKIPSKYKFSLPKYYPFICNFFILQNNFLLVLTYENDNICFDSIKGDIFNEKGEYISKVEAPFYFDPYLSEHGHKENTSALLKGEYFYTLVVDKDTGKTSIKRYKLTWERGI